MNYALFFVLALVSTPVAFAAGEGLYDRPAIESWLNSDVPRGNGDLKNMFPKGLAMKYCAGAGCPIKIPFTFTEAQIRHFGEVMNDASRNMPCESPASCERMALQFALREMDRTVRDEKLRNLTIESAIDVSVYRYGTGDNSDPFSRLSAGQWFLRDCVDQAANGSSFLVILASEGLIHFHRVVGPGHTTFHFFTMIRELGPNQLYMFDMYREPRTDFDKLAFVKRL